jgi:thioredoxin-related protein
MKVKTLFTAILGLFLLTGGALAEAGWHTTWDAAAKESKTSGKPILIDFTGSDWCGWCVKLKKEVFDTSEFKSWAKDNVVLLELDFPRGKAQSAKEKADNKELAQKYEVKGFPTIIFADTKGEVLGRYGYDSGGPGVWTKKAETFLP